MNTTTIIEERLKAIDSATFQKMINHLLCIEGYKFISSPGSVVGRNKTSKGTPDSFFEEDDDCFAFCECTTKEKLGNGLSFMDKLLSDIDHCFNVTKTKIEINRVSKVILAFTEKLEPNEKNELNDKVKAYNPYAELCIYSIQQLSFKLQYYPNLTEQYLGVKTTNGTIYTLHDFLEITRKGIQPSLINPFIGREEELRQAKELLSRGNILVLTGKQGVGKSKIAVKLAQELEAEHGFEPRIILSSPIEIWNDLNNFILPNKKYVILFDDANKAIPNLDYLLHFIRTRGNNEIKVLITVRDYVRQNIERNLSNSTFSEISIETLKDDQIREVVKQSIPHLQLESYATERIVDVAKGNARIALMATVSVVKHNDLKIIENAGTLYADYFKQVNMDVSFQANPFHMKALGILSFFGVLDYNDVEIKSTLESNFGISWNQLWEAYFELEKSELVDVYYKESVKISDQVLATYVFYQTFLDEQTACISYAQFVICFLKKERKIIRSLNDVLATFGIKELKPRLTAMVQEMLQITVGDHEKNYDVLKIFWFCRELDTLLFIKRWIEVQEQEHLSLTDIKFSYENNAHTLPSDYIELMLPFWDYETPLMSESLKLGLSLAFKQPSRIPELLKHLDDHLAYKRYDYIQNYSRQFVLLDHLLNSYETERENKIVEQLFLHIAPSLLKWEGRETEGNRGRSITIHTFQLRKNEELMQLRQKVFLKLFELFSVYEEKVLDILNGYAWGGFDFEASVYAEEQELISGFFKNKFNKDKFAHCKVIKRYLATLKRHKIKSTSKWSGYTNSKMMKIAKVFTMDIEDRIQNDEDSRVLKKAVIKKLIEGKNLAFIKILFAQLEDIYQSDHQARDTYSIDENIAILFNVLLDVDKSLFLSTLELIMSQDTIFNLNDGNIIYYPINKKLIDFKELYNFIDKYNHKYKQFWKRMCFTAIHETEINEFVLQEFIAFISNMEGHFYIHFDDYRKFESTFLHFQSNLPIIAQGHSNIITFITETLLNRIPNTRAEFPYNFCQKYASYFTGKTNLLKQLYIYGKTKDKHYDHDSEEMAVISKIDPSFLVEYLEVSTKDQDFLNYRFDELHLDFIWDMPDHKATLDLAMEIIISKAPYFSSFKHTANILFCPKKWDENKLNLAYSYISEFIAKHNRQKQHMLIIMNVVTNTFHNQQIRFLREFLLINKDVEFIRSMYLNARDVTWGSIVPHLEEEITRIELIIDMIKKLPNPLDYREHVEYYERSSEGVKKYKREELKRNFMDSD